MRRFKWLVLIVVLCLAMSAVAGYLLCEMALHPGRKLLSKESRSTAQKIAGLYGASLEDVSLVQMDGVKCRGWYFRHPLNPNGRSVLVLHGLSNNRSGMMGYIEMFVANGYDVLAPDFRDHGESDGNIATYGLLEKYDVHRWVQWLLEKEHNDQIYGLGESMGAAILLESLETNPRFRAVAAESSFSNFAEIGCDRVSQKLGFWYSPGRVLFRPAVDAGMLWAWERYHLDFANVSPEHGCALSRIPILLIHSEVDDNIPFRHALRILAAAGANGNKIEFWAVPDGGHASTFGKHPAEFKRRVLSFFDRAAAPRQ